MDHTMLVIARQVLALRSLLAQITLHFYQVHKGVFSLKGALIERVLLVFLEIPCDIVKHHVVQINQLDHELIDTHWRDVVHKIRDSLFHVQVDFIPAETIFKVRFLGNVLEENIIVDFDDVEVAAANNFYSSFKVVLLKVLRHFLLNQNFLEIDLFAFK